ncbi:MAG: hypothetical protein FDZ70_08755 [Actinobacteria bacterium]|nr:MAG: hypothetical protein FDZ70_08755 [Actinomycetota bacterium]
MDTTPREDDGLAAEEPTAPAPDLGDAGAESAAGEDAPVEEPAPEEGPGPDEAAELGDAGTEPAEEPEPVADPGPAEGHVAWQLTLPEVDTPDGPGAVPLSEVSAEADAESAAVEAEGAGPDDEHLFDIAPETVVATEPDSEAALPEIDEGPAGRSPLPWWPYLTYVGLWVALGVAIIVVSNRLGDPYLPESGAYPPLLLAGLLLAVVGPFVGVAGWAIARRALPQSRRSGLLSAALLRAGAFTLGGVVLWWAAFVLVDALRLGWI